MTHREFMKQSLCKFQFTQTRNSSYAIDTNFNFYFIHIREKKQTSISMIKNENLRNVAVLKHSLPIMTFESKILNKTITLIAQPLDYPRKIAKLYKILES